MRSLYNFISDLDGLEIFLIIVFLFSFWLVIHKVFISLFGLENYKAYVTRERQLKFENRKKYTSNSAEIIDKTTNPIIKYFSNFLPSRNVDKINKNLEFIGWDKYMDAQRYYALWLVFIIVGIAVGLFFITVSKLFSLIVLLLCIFILPVLYRNEIKDKKDKLLFQFPDFIRMTEGYLRSGATFQSSLESSLPYIGDEWKPLIQELIVDMKLNATSVALENLKNKVDMFEVTEFVSMVILALDQGGDAKTAFESQAVSIQKVMFDLMEKRVMQRNIMAQVVQPIVLIDIMLVFALPMGYQMFQTMGSMG